MMSGNNWGPFSELEGELSKLNYKGFPDCNSYYKVVKKFGGLWGLCSQDILPASLRSPQYTDKHIGDFSAQNLSKILIKCYAWLEKRTFQFLAPLFSPFCQNIPVKFFKVSEESLFWTLVAYALDTQGYAAVFNSPDLRKECPLVNLSVDKKYHLNNNASLADRICLHINIEELIQSNNFPLFHQHTPNTSKRKPGGLRKLFFLRKYPGLVNMSEVSEDVPNWLKALKLLIDVSPLTQIVYFDVIGKVVPSTTLMPLLKTRDRSKKEVPDEFPEVWLSQIARSLVGGILSPSPNYEKWEKANAIQPNIKRNGSNSQNFHNQPLSQYLEKIKIIALMFEKTKKNEGSLYLHIQTLDMLIRYIVSQLNREIQTEWKTMKIEIPANQAKNELFLEQGVCFLSFVKIVLGRPLKEIAALDDKQLGWLSSFLRPQVDIGDNTIKHIIMETGVEQSSIKRLLHRFTDDESCGVNLPLPNNYNRGNAPARIFSHWFVMLNEQLQQKSRATERTGT